MYVCVLAVKLRPNPCNPMDCSLPDSSVHGILWKRIQEWIVISFSRRSSQPRDQTCISCIAGGFFTSDPPEKPLEDCFCPVAKLCPTLHPTDCSMPGFPVLHYFLEFPQSHVHWVGDGIWPSHPLSSPSFAFNLSQHQVFPSESALCIRWPKCWSFSFSISPSNEYSGLISLRTDWFDLLAVQGNLKSLLQCHSSKASIFPMLNLLYGPTLTSIHDYWKNHSFHYMDLCWQSNVFAF